LKTTLQRKVWWWMRFGWRG